MLNSSHLRGLVVLVVLAVCGGPLLADAPATRPATTQSAEAQKLADEMMAVSEQLLVILSTVKDVESANAAVPKLEEQFKPMRDVAERVGKLSPADQKAVMHTLMSHPRAAAMQQQAGKDLQRIQADPALKQIIDPVMKRMPGVRSAEEIPQRQPVPRRQQ